MSENIENLVLEHLKRFQAGQDRIESKLEEIIHRLGHLEVGTSSTKRDIAGIEENDAALSIRMDKINSRIDRIEKRLEIN
jgi:hypothetical protein